MLVFGGEKGNEEVCSDTLMRFVRNSSWILFIGKFKTAFCLS